MLPRQHATVIEADGRLAYDGPGARSGQAWADKRRTDRLLDLGDDVHPFVFAHLHRPEARGRGLLRVFERSCRRTGRPAPSLACPWA